MTKYYYAGTQRVAMRNGSTLYWLLGDHLGSTTITADSSGNRYGELRYKAWGENRYTYGTTLTSFRYTGQRSEETGFGLYYYGARWYDSALSRFVQTDTIVPEQTQGVQTWDRYAYVNNNPMIYTDPSGHAACSDYGECPSDINKPSLNIPGSSQDWNTAAKVFDVIAWLSDIYASAAVTFAGIAGAGIPTIFLPVGVPEVPVVTGLAGMGITELYVQPILTFGNVMASLGTASTIIADSKDATIPLESNTINSMVLTGLGLITREAYLSLAIQSLSLANDFGWISIPVPNY